MKYFKSCVSISLLAFVSRAWPQQQTTNCLNAVVLEETVASAVSVPDENGEEILAAIALYAADIQDFPTALHVASKIKDNRGLYAHQMLDHLLGRLAMAQAEVDDFDGARTTARRMHQKDAYLFVQIAALQAEKGDLQGALKSVRHLNTEGRDTILDGDVRHKLQTGNISAALLALNAIHNKGDSLWAIMYEQARKGDLEAAFKTAKRIRDKSSREQTTDGIVNARLEAGDFVTAKNLAKSLPQDVHVRALYDIGEAQAKAGMTADAQASFEQASELASQLTSIFKGDTLGRIVEHQIRLGLPVTTMKQIDALPNGYDRWTAFIGVGKALLAAGKVADAQAMFEKAPYPALAAVAKATAGDVSGALDSLRQSDSWVYVDAYMVDIIERTAQRGNVLAALSLIKHISAERRPFLGAEALEKIARAQTLRGDSVGAIKWARTQTDPRFRASALFGVLQGRLEKCKPGSTDIEGRSPLVL